VRAVIQRVTEARVVVEGKTIGQIGPGLCVFLGVSRTDDESKASGLAEKIKNLRIFADAQGKMNRSVADIRGAVLVVSQFTLYGDCSRGNRPSFTDAAAPGEAERLYNYFIQRLHASGLTVATGQFQCLMNVYLINDGPVTLILEI
jgi:D-aminoacyl-tRNA deacylase